MFNKKSYTAVFVKDSLNYYMLLDINCIFQVVVLSSISSQRGKKWKYVIDFYGIFWGNFFFFLDLDTMVVTSLFLCMESKFFRDYKISLWH